MERNEEVERRERTVEGGESRVALWQSDSHQPLAGCPTAPITSGWVTRQEGPGGVRVRCRTSKLTTVIRTSLRGL